MKVRYYGFLAAASKKKFKTLLELLFMDEQSIRSSKSEQASQITRLCPNCGSVLQWVQKLEPG